MAVDVHITRVTDTEANVLAQIDDGQSVFLNDQGFQHVKRRGSLFDYFTPNKHWTGAAFVYHDVNYNDVTARNDLIVQNRISGFGDSNTYLDYSTDDQILAVAGAVEFWRMTETAQDIMTFNNAAVDVDYRFNSAAGSPAIFIQGSSGKVGFGIALPDGTVHIQTSDASVGTAPGAGSDLIIENGTNAGLSILTPNTGLGSIFFGDPESTGVGFIRYTHSNNSLSFTTNSSLAATFDSAGKLGIGIAAADTLLHVHNATAGSADPATNTVLTIENNTDAFITILKPDADSGGLLVGGPSDGDAGQFIYNGDTDRWQMGFASTVHTHFGAGFEDHVLQGFSAVRSTTGVSTLISSSDIGLAGLVMVTIHVDDGGGGQDVSVSLLSYSISIDGASDLDVIQSTGDALGGLTFTFQFTNDDLEVNVSAISGSHVATWRARLIKTTWTRS